jgi:uncharacterized membrane protein
MGFCANGLGWGGWGHMGGWGGLGWLGWLGPLFGLLLLAGLIGLLVLGAVWLVRRTGQPAAAVPQSGAEPLEIARRRLAAGEITSREFEELRDKLRG